jgi:hypothetical protein
MKPDRGGHREELAGCPQANHAADGREGHVAEDQHGRPGGVEGQVEQEEDEPERDRHDDGEPGGRPASGWLMAMPGQDLRQTAEGAKRHGRVSWSGELGGACGDLGTFVPLVVGAITVVGLAPAGVLICFGVFLMASRCAASGDDRGREGDCADHGRGHPGPAPMRHRTSRPSPEALRHRHDTQTERGLHHHQGE